MGRDLKDCYPSRKDQLLFLNMISAKYLFNVGCISLSQKAVAPITGAWIETHLITIRLESNKVAPIMGAAIERCI